jgi:type II secretory pathway predicted ATPase ExeA
LAFLKYGLGQGDGFIVITGDIGTGKTTLVQTLLADLDPNEAVVANLVTTQLREDDLLTLVAYQFGLRPNGPSKAMLLRDLELFFLHRTRERKRVLLIVDEAQNLPPASVEELRMLSNFQYQGRPLVQVFLLGQQEFRGTLLSDGFEQLRQRIIATYHLNPLDAAETRAYVEHRLNLVGWHGDPSLTDDAFERIYGFSEGVSRRVNNLCDRNEFVGGDLDKSKGGSPVSEPVNQPLESMARMMFDKANVQQRLASLERAVDTLGHGRKDERNSLTAPRTHPRSQSPTREDRRGQQAQTRLLIFRAVQAAPLIALP